MVSFLVANHLWFGWSFVFCAVFLALNLCFMIPAGKFPPIGTDVEVEENGEEEEVTEQKGSLWFDGTLFILYEYISQTTFYLVSQWVSEYGSQVAHMGSTAAHSLVSYYSLGSIICVLVTAVLSAKAVKEVQFLSVYTLISFVALLLMYLFPTGVICSIMSFVVGFSAAGGVMQLGLTVMADFFPKGKGTVTGIFYTAGSIASFTVPIFTGMMASNLSNVILFDVIVALLGFVVTTLITIRYYKLFGKKAKA